VQPEKAPFWQFEKGVKLITIAGMRAIVSSRGAGQLPQRTVHIQLSKSRQRISPPASVASARAHTDE
jgi:hypothetical protein